MSKRILAIILAVLIILSLSACGKKDGNTGTGHIKDGFVFKGGDSVIGEAVDLGMPEIELNPQDIYNKITYTPEMFYGDYRIRGGDKAEEEFGASTNYFTWTRNGKETEFSTLPFQIQAGKDTMNHSINFVEDYDWMKLNFMHKYGENQCSMDTVICSYSIDGNKLVLKPLDKFEVDKENNKITYSFSDATWEYMFSFSGRYLTLTSGEDSVTLMTGLDAYGEVDYFSLGFVAGNYLSEGSKSVADIDNIDFSYDSEDGDSDFYIELLDGTTSYNSIAVLQENGLFTFTIALENGNKTYQYVCFYCGRDGIVLTDGTEVYYYNDSYSDRKKTQLNEYLTEDQTGKLDELSDSQLEAIVEKKENLMEDLAKAFNDAGIKVTVDEKSGELAMDSSILFGGDSAILTAEGKTFLNKFVNVYTSIVFSDKYEGFVSKTMIEGHTAPVSGSTYESGLPLSEQRANNVKNYCVSSEMGVDTSKLAANLEATGLSNSKPVYDNSGKVDMAASRRVSFRFIINLEQN